MIKNLFVFLIFPFLLCSCLDAPSSSTCESECQTAGTEDEAPSIVDLPSNETPSTPLPPAPPTPPTPPPSGNWGPELNSARVFLSGHSLMDNPLADYLQDLSTKKADDFNYNQQIVIGSPIRVRTAGLSADFVNWPGYSEGKNRGGSTGLDVVSELRSPQTLGPGDAYDNFILTENHNIMDMIVWEKTTELVRQYHDLFIEGNSAGRSFFYHSWLNVDKTNPQPWIDHEKNSETVWECVASKVNLSLAADTRVDKLKVLPAGGALVSLVEAAIAGNVPGVSGSTQQKLDLIFDDNVHLTDLGKYFVAAVVYSSVYRKSPAAVSPPSGSGISSSTAASLQSLAWNYVRDYYNEVNGSNEPTMSQCRALMVNSYCDSYYNGLSKTSPSEAQSCISLNSGSSSYFRWPDPGFTTYSTP